MSDMEKNLSLPTGLRVFSEGQWVEVCSVRDIERLESELAEANAKIKAARALHRAHSVLTAECVSCRGFFPCRTIRALESATPQGSLAGSTIQAKDDQC